MVITIKFSSWLWHWCIERFVLAGVPLAPHHAYAFVEAEVWYCQDTYLTLSVHALEGYCSHFVCLSVCLSVCESVVDLEDGGLLVLQIDTNLNNDDLSYFTTFLKFGLVLKKKLKTMTIERTLDHTH